jgi:hypothetical protein
MLQAEEGRWPEPGCGRAGGQRQIGLLSIEMGQEMHSPCFQINPNLRPKCPSHTDTDSRKDTFCQF